MSHEETGALPNAILTARESEAIPTHVQFTREKLTAQRLHFRIRPCLGACGMLKHCSLTPRCLCSKQFATPPDIATAPSDPSEILHTIPPGTV